MVVTKRRIATNSILATVLFSAGFGGGEFMRGDGSIDPGEAIRAAVAGFELRIECIQAAAEIDAVAGDLANQIQRFSENPKGRIFMGLILTQQLKDVQEKVRVLVGRLGDVKEIKKVNRDRRDGNEMKSDTGNKDAKALNRAGETTPKQ